MKSLGRWGRHWRVPLDGGTARMVASPIGSAPMDSASGELEHDGVPASGVASSATGFAVTSTGSAPTLAARKREAPIVVGGVHRHHDPPRDAVTRTPTTARPSAADRPATAT